MRPGEVVTGEGAAPAAAPTRRGRVTVFNSGRFPAYLGSHFAISNSSAALEFDRGAVTGARPDLPAGATIRIDAGAERSIDVIWD